MRAQPNRLIEMSQQKTPQDRASLLPIRFSPFPLPALDALSLLKRDGVIHAPVVYNEEVILVTPRGGFGWGNLGRRYSALTGGQTWSGQRSITHNRGGSSPRRCTWMMPLPSLDKGQEDNPLADVFSARKVYQILTGEEPRSWSISGLARGMIRWTGLEQKASLSRKTPGPCEVFLHGATWHYYRCLPGELREAHLHDMRACYWELASRLPSPYVGVNVKSEPIFFRVEPEKLERWRSLLQAIRPHKKLRNVLIGCCAGGRGTFWTKGQESKEVRLDGPLRPLALLVVRTAQELCAGAQEAEEASRKGAYYSNTDCVISLEEEAPLLWRELGIPTKLQASGKAKICSIGVYKVGDYATRWFIKGSRFQGPAATLRLDGPDYLRWLREVSR